MFRKSATLLLLVMMVPVLVSAQTVVSKRSFVHDKPAVINEVSMKTLGVGNKTTIDGDYKLIDLMSNSYGPAIGTINPFVFDPYSGVVAFAHRGDASYGASGQVWYNISTDFGATWTRVAGVNVAASQKAARYPSMTISNPTHGDISVTTAGFAWPELNPAAFGFVGYGADQPVGGAATFSEIVDPSTYGHTNTYYSSQVPIWSGDTRSEILWTSDNGENNTFDLWSTTDYGTVNRATLYENETSWHGAYTCVGGVSFGDTTYMGYVCLQYATDSTGYPTFAYVKSGDGGATWTPLKFASWSNIPALAKYDEPYTAGGQVNHQADINVDKYGRVHFLAPMTGMVVNGTDTSYVSDLVDLFESGSGWDGNVVGTGLVDSVYLTGPALGQMGACAELAFDQTRSVMVAQWVNAGVDGFADIYVAYKGVDDKTWSAPVNLTNSSSNNTSAHLAQYLKKDGDTYTAFSMYTYPISGNGEDVATQAGAYCAAYTFTYVPTGINDPVTTVNNYSLSQNYPNPFNPSTSFTYSLAEKGLVTLKVYDVLGKEVATLVNGQMEKGSHTVSFNASNLASGLYIYTLKAGNTSISKKMMLMK